MDKKAGWIHKIKKVARTAILVTSAFWFGFSLLSGADSFGGGIQGVLRNSPNALPWFFLLIFVYLYWSYEIVSASLIFLIGLFTLYFYQALRSPFVLFAITLPVLILGAILLVTSILSQNHQGRQVE